MRETITKTLTIMKRILALSVGLFSTFFVQAQEQHIGLSTAPRGGVIAADLNPAELSNMRYKYEVGIFALQTGFYNNNVKLKDISSMEDDNERFESYFADGKTADVDKNLFIDAPSDITTRITFKKGKGKLQLVSLVATEGVITPGAVVYRPSEAAVYTDAVVQTITTQTTNGTANTNVQNPTNGNVNMNVNATGMNQTQTNQSGNVGMNVNVNASENGTNQTQSTQNQNANFNMNVSGSGMDPNMQNGSVGISINVSGMDPNMQNGNMGVNMNVTGMEQQQVNPNTNVNMNMNVNANGIQTQNTNNGNVQMNVNSNGMNTQQSSGQTTITTTTTTTTTNSGGNVNYQATNQQNQVNHEMKKM